MNRNERRRSKQPDNEKTYTFKQSVATERIKTEIDREMSLHYAKLSQEVVNSSLAVVIKVLHDKYGFGKQRLTGFINEFTEQFDSIGKEYATFEDVAKLAEELGVSLDGEVL